MLELIGEKNMRLQKIENYPNFCSKKKNTKRSSVLLLRLVFFFFGTDVMFFFDFLTEMTMAIDTRLANGLTLRMPIPTCPSKKVIIWH